MLTSMNATYDTIDRLVADRRHALEEAADRHRLVRSSRCSRVLALLPTRLTPRAPRIGPGGEPCQAPTTAAA